MIEIKDLAMSFGKKVVLHDVNCQLESGVYGILGPNGAGKTTLLRCIAGLYEQYTGTILSDAGDQRPDIGYLPQKFSIYPDLTVLDNMQYFAALKKIPKADRREKIEGCLRAVHMEPYENHKGSQLSGGMLRRVGIAQAMLNDPAVMLLDEPTVGLDPEERIHFKEIVSGLREDMVVMMSTHIVEDVEACCRSILVMHDGTICFMGNGEALRQQARGKVYEAVKEEVTVWNDVYVEKEYEKEDRIVRRILTAGGGYQAVEETIEDGYLCVIKNI